MKKILIVAMLLIAVIVQAEERDNPFTKYKDNYIIAGNGDDQVKYQMSYKYALLWPFDNTPYFGYTQLAMWRLYDKSAPFKDYNHNPELFYKIGDIRSIQFGVEHISNGRDGEESRSMNDYYIQSQLSGMIGNIQIGVIIKGQNYFHVSNQNSDIDDYKGYFSGEFFVQLKNDGKYLDKERLSIKGGGNRKWWYEVDLKFRILTSKIQPFLFIQYRDGYAESLLNYSERDRAIRAGFIFQ